MQMSIVLLAVFAALVIAIPVVIGIYVYRDAKNRSMPPALWTGIAVLAPGFIGFIIYLVVRGDYPAMHCPKCGGGIRDEFMVCPHCGTELKARCKNCGFPVEPSWKRCPQCATTAENETAVSGENGRSDRGLKTVLLLVIIIPVAICLLLIMGLLAYNFTSSAIDMTLNDNIPLTQIETHSELTEWLEKCDKNGSGVYVLRNISTGNSGEVSTEYLLYRNDGSYMSHSSIRNDGLFRKPVIGVDFEEREDSKNVEGCLSYYKYIGRGSIDLDISDESGYVNYTVEDTDMPLLLSADVDALCLKMRVNVAENVENVYTISFEYYDEQGNVLSESACNMANGSSLSVAASEEYYYPERDGVAAFSIAAEDGSGEELCRTEKFDIEGNLRWEFDITANSWGEVSIDLAD